QKSAKVTPYVVWDYHVILIQQNATKYLVYDLDSTIDFPCEIHIYWKETMRTDIPLNERYRRWFRVVNALEYLKHFSSDRRHMRNDRNEFVAPPPCWPPIFDENRGHNLDQFISMSEETLAHISNVYDESTLQQRFLCEV
ncbi:Protein N-terminal glutamine amidohydrolase, partial [Toxocara canis]